MEKSVNFGSPEKWEPSPIGGGGYSVVQNWGGNSGICDNIFHPLAARQPVLLHHR